MQPLHEPLSNARVCLCIADNPNRNWPSENDLFDDEEAHSMGSVQSYDKSVENIVQRRSRVSSQENGESAKLESEAVVLGSV